MLNTVLTGINSPMALFVLASIAAAAKNGVSWAGMDRIWGLIGAVFPLHGESRLAIDRPVLTWWANDDEAVVSVGGIPNIGVGAELVRAYYGPYDPPFNSLFNSSMRQAADGHIVVLQGTPIPRVSRVTYVGYSYGGGVANGIQYFFGSGAARPDDQVLTIGSPACMRPRSTGMLPNCYRVALFTDTDPIPFLCPAPQVAPPWYWLEGPDVQRRLQDWWYPGNRLQVDVNGVLTETNQPSNAGTDWGLSMLGWVSGTMVTPVEGHEIQTYVSRLLRCALGSGDLVIRPEPQGVHLPFPRAPLPPPAEDAFIVPLPVDQPPTTQTPSAPLTIGGFGPVARYVARKDGTPWGVWYKGQPVIQKLRKKSAKALARKLNNVMTPSDRAGIADLRLLLASVGEQLYGIPGEGV